MVRFWIAGLIVAASVVGSARAQTAPDFVALTPPIDFSHAGYRGGGAAAPVLPVVIRVEPGEGDDTARILAAIDRVSKTTPDAEGRRGAVFLGAGEFQVEGRIRLDVGGVALRGAEGQATTIVATGVDRRPLIAIGSRVPAPEPLGADIPVLGDSPVGAVRLTLETTEGLEPGDAVTIRRPSTAKWIAALGMDAFVGWRPESRLNWRPGSRDVVWDRRIVAVERGIIVLDAPLTMALAAGDGAAMRRAPSVSRIGEVGVENLRLVSRHDPRRPADEDHSWTGIAVDRAEDVWLRNIAFEGFVGSAIDLGPDSRRVTAQDVNASRPVSEIGGLRRRTFYTAGQQTLFQRCASSDGIHDFAVGHAAAGPNVFLDCTATDSHRDSGTQESWATGALFDGVKVRGGGLTLTNRGRDGQGVGWSAANSVLWNCEATVVEVRNPPGAANVAVGCRGERIGDGVLEDARVMPGRDFHRAQPQEPASLYRMQLERRLGEAGLAALAPAVFPTEAPRASLLTDDEVKAWRQATARPVASHPLTVADGWFVIDGQPAWRRRIGFAFFQAQMVPALAEASGPFITRFAPGLEGQGLTDDLNAFAAGLKTGDVVHHNYGLWYDRRRVDHDFYGSPDQRDGEVWGPFMELPWARSGQGRAWDGLSKFDLERFNPWFFNRIARFADLAEQQGVVLYHKFYLQHWLLESRSHYVDFPWRPVNTLQATGMPNEVPAAEVFWDVSNPVRRDLHRLYIRHTLETLKGRDNVVIGLDPEYTGPLSFVQFWLDEIAAWEAETGADVRVALEVPKDQMDVILDDPIRGRTVDAVGFHHWTYRPDGTLFAVRGGLDKAPREQVDAIARPQDLTGGIDAGEARRALWRSTPAMRYRAYREYRDRRSDLVVLDADDAFSELSRAIEAAAPAAARASLRPSVDLLAPSSTAWASEGGNDAALIYNLDGAAMELVRPLAAGRAMRWIAEGVVVDRVALGDATHLAPPPELAGRPLALWIAPAP
ncbi:MULTISPECIES: DUF6298 domain-containing protein [unclassified Brevundimonas]|uniref:DUF6298 domain-containing protein n=1 Tax=unclassified Brevundimonas TaxID=2622653 RepID=UPI0025C3B71A|nr:MULTISPECIES: DUF6298 domain-containing protein [unclassified Brevundimonas]